MTQPNIIFASTAYGPLWAPAVSSWLRAVAYASRYFAVQVDEVDGMGKIGGCGVTDRLYTMTAENQIVKEALAKPEVTHIFMTEMDMVLPHDTITKLVALDKDITSGLYFLRSHLQVGRGQPCLYKKSTAVEAKRALHADINYYHSPVTMFPMQEPFRVDCAGLGCTLFKREVFEKLEYPWFDLKAGTDIKIGYGSDMYFYTHAKRAGIELWVDPTVRCRQIDYYETDIEDYQWQIENNPKFASSGFIIGYGDGTNGATKAQRGSGADASQARSD